MTVLGARFASDDVLRESAVKGLAGATSTGSAFAVVIVVVVADATRLAIALAMPRR
jgi:hypothetical protein